MIYGYTIFYVDNVPATIEFYKKAFGFERKFVTPEEDYGELSSGATTIAFGSIELGKSNFKNGFQKFSSASKPIGMELVFVSEDLEEDFQTALDAGATLLEEIIQKPWGQKVGYVQDINGIIIEMCTPIKS